MPKYRFAFKFEEYEDDKAGSAVLPMSQIIVDIPTARRNDWRDAPEFPTTPIGPDNYLDVAKHGEARQVIEEYFEAAMFLVQRSILDALRAHEKAKAREPA